MKKRKNIFKRNSLIVILTLILIVSLLGCSKSDEYATTDSMSKSDGANYLMDSDEEMAGAPMVDVVYSEDMATDTTSAVGESPNPDSGGADLSDRKIIETRNISMETLDFDATTKSVEDLVYNNLGYIESSNVTGKGYNQKNNEYNPRYAYFTLRVPAEYYEGFVDQLITYGYVTSNNVDQQDVTTQYMDLTARIETMEIQEERLLSLLETSAKLEDILELERELADVRYEIETNQSYLNGLDNRVRYSTVYLEVREVFEIVEIEEVPVTFTERISSGFSKSLNGVIDGIVDFVVWFVGNLPALVIWGLILFGLFIVIRRFFRKNQRPKDEKSKETNMLSNIDISKKNDNSNNDNN